MSPLLRIVLVLLLVLAMAPMGMSQERPQASSEARSRAKARWMKLAPAQREEMLRRYREFKALPPEARAPIRGQIARLQRMSPEERQAFRRKLATLSPEERRELLSRGTGLAQMPQPKRNVIRVIADLVGPLSPEQRQKLNSLRGRERDFYVRSVIEQKFAEKFLTSLDERAMFQAAPPGERMRKMKQMLEPKIRHLLPPRKEEGHEKK